MVILMPLA
jgi:hypothetical protein